MTNQTTEWPPNTTPTNSNIHLDYYRHPYSPTFKRQPSRGILIPYYGTHSI